MLQIKNICKEYRTGNLVQKALDHVSLNLRDSEFVAILGPSGSGKTTLLNVIGGLDSYDSGDLIINGVSTKKYRSRDWDAYRNHTIGFVFQSYNLIPHQTILANVELTLTISGISKAERRKRSVEALARVGLADQLHKKPSQLSGGQMQRVAIARALVNNPDILLADEPTGALDSETSVQVMELLREVARDRLVVMVTHNPELAEEYATRIVRLRDGKIQSDSRPFQPETGQEAPPVHKKMGKASMSFLTALSLSFNNLRTKKARTLLTSFAGSIGIIGIALILAVSTGANAYIDGLEEETLAEYPVQIQSTGLDFASMMNIGAGGGGEKAAGDQEVGVFEILKNLVSSTNSNDLASLKKYLDSGNSGIRDCTSAIEYTYSAVPHIYRESGGSIRQVHPDVSFQELGLGSGSSSNSLMSTMMSTDVFYQMPEEASLYEEQYEVKAGRWPENYQECVVVLTEDGSISDFMLYTLGLRDALELDEMIQEFIDEKPVETPEDYGTYSYEDVLGTSFKLVNPADCYQYDSQYQVWVDKSQDADYMKGLVRQGEDISVVGVVQPAKDANGFVLTSGIAYPASLTAHVAEKAAESRIVQDQLARPDVDVLTGDAFGEEKTDTEFDMDSLLTVDTEALEELFQVDQDALAEELAGSLDLSGTFSQAGESLDLSGLVDLGAVQVEVPGMPSLSLSGLMENLEIRISEDSLRQLAQGLLDGYGEYAAEHPEADYSGLGENLLEYLRTEEAGDILSRHIQAIIDSNGDYRVTKEELQDLFGRVLAGYGEYAAANGWTDPDRLEEYLLEYLRTEEAGEILDQWSSEVFPEGEITVPPEQLEALAADLYGGYREYASSNGLPDVSRMGEYFADYLGTPKARELLARGMASMVDTQALEQQIAGSLETYMGQTMNAYGEALGENLESGIRSALGQMMDQMASGMEAAMAGAFSRLGEELEAAMSIDGEAFADAFHFNMDGEELEALMMSMGSAENATYEGNLAKFGYADFEDPSSIDIYPLDFESKEKITGILDDYNSRMEAEGREDQVISYTDMVGSLMSSVTEIINIISYVLIAFVGISLVVSSIMIGVITYISVLERRKEIGILRAIGASRRNVSQVFNAETFIIGACAGLLGIGVTLLLLIPGNAAIHYFAKTDEISGSLPPVGAAVLVILSIVLTLISGLLPARKAAKSDPVTALRVE